MYKLDLSMGKLSHHDSWAFSWHQKWIHATRKMIPFVRDKLWILTGCVCSKMEIAMIEGFKELNIEYLNNRVFLNYSGNRPAEPSSGI